MICYFATSQETPHPIKGEILVSGKFMKACLNQLFPARWFTLLGQNDSQSARCAGSQRRIIEFAREIICLLKNRMRPCDFIFSPILASDREHEFHSITVFEALATYDVFCTAKELIHRERPASGSGIRQQEVVHITYRDCA